MSTEVRLSTRDPAPEKIQARHCDRHAVVYVRQSTLRQVEQNRESTRLQYGLADRACRLGWPREQIVIIDEDLGRSGASSSDRPGFQRLVAEVGLGHVGLVLGIEVSRLARSCRDWHQLLEMCALFDTLIGDADGIYDPGNRGGGLGEGGAALPRRPQYPAARPCPRGAKQGGGVLKPPQPSHARRHAAPSRLRRRIRL